MSAVGGRIQRVARGHKYTSGACLGVLLMACGALALVSLLTGGAQSRSPRGLQDQAAVGEALRGKTTLAQAPAGLRAAVERDAKLSDASAGSWSLRASYGAASVRLSGPGWSARVGLGSAGRGGALVPVSGVVRHAELAALYGRSGVRESFATGPRGVIQTFDVSTRPSGGGQLVLEFGISGLRATGSGRRLSLRDAQGRIVASYRFLRVTDARGRVVKANLRATSGGRKIVLEIADRHALYPLRVEPMFAAMGRLDMALAAVPARAGLSAAYGSDSVRLSGPKLSGTVGLGEVGRAGALDPVSGALKLGSAQSAQYQGSGITETFTDGAVGVEQSFKITRRPGGSGPLVLDVGLSGLLASGSGSTLALHGASGATVGAYSGLRVTDADGRVVTASMSPGPDGRGIVISVDDRTARYPLLVDPTYTQIAEVTDSTSGSAFGDAVAVSGSTALIGASGSANGGEAYIYTSTGGNWTATQALTAPAGASSFGTAVAISGSTAVVSASTSGGLGVAYVYTLSGGVWSYATELTAPDGASGDEYGHSVATSGGVIAVGAPDHEVGGTNYVGATYIYTLSTGTWFYTAELVPNDNDEFDESGYSVAISESGTTVVAGANDSPAGNIPSAYVYTLSSGVGGSWGLTQKLVAPNATTTYGVAAPVAISGSTIVLGGSEFINGDAGQAYVYTNSGSGWSLAATLNPADYGGYFGSAVAISGGTIVVGAFGHELNSASGPADAGAAYVFTGSGSSWTQQPTDLLASDAARGEEFASEVAVSGSTILVGNASTNGGVTDAYFFGIPVQTGPTFTVTTTSDTNDGACYVTDCSLRDAITAANAYPTAAVEPTIDFNIPGGGVQTISPATPLPTITNAMVIDGTSEPGYPGSFSEPDFPGTADSPLIDIDGSSCSSACSSGLNVAPGQTTIEGLAIEGFSGFGILLDGGNNTVRSDWIGENPSTQAFDGNADVGVDVNSDANNIYGDLIAGNGGGLGFGSGANIEISGGFENAVSSDDLTGDPNGSAAGQDSQGVEIVSGATDNTIGGVGPDNDVINGYIDNGVDLNNAGRGNVIEGDAIGITGGPNPQVPNVGGQASAGIEVAYTSGTVIGDNAAPGTQANTAYGNVIGGNTQSGSSGIAVVDNSQDTRIAGNYIGTDSTGDTGLGNFEGVDVDSGATANVIGPDNTVADNTGPSGVFNEGTGVVIDGPGNEVTANSIHDNSGPGIGIGGGFTSVTAPTLTANSTQAGSATAINGTVSGSAGSSVAVDLFDSPTCAAGGGGTTYLGTEDVTIGSGGTAAFSIATAKPSAGDSITATATTTVTGASSPSTSAFSGCSSVISTAGNDEWTNAQLITPNSSGAGSATGSIDLSGQARWYKVPISPGGSVSVNLSNLPADYNLSLFSDIGQAEASLTSNSSDEPTTENLQALQAEQPGNAFSPSVFSPSVFSPSVFSPSVFSPSVFSPSVFSPSVFSPSVFSPSVFSPSVFSPSVVSPSVFSPSVFSPSVFSPSVFSPATPVLDAEDYEDAQLEALLAVSDTGGDANQQVSADTWNNTGYFYIRVSGANGAYAPGQDFSLGVQVNSGTCGGVSSSSAQLLSSSVPVGSGSGYKTLILTDESRMTNDGDLANMESDLTTFAGESSVDGTILDVGTDSPQVEALQSQAQQNPDCAEAQNLVAGAIQQIVGTVRQANPGLKYIVIIGDDHVIPFFRYPDTAGLAPESGYVPPVLDTSPSYASLESDDFLSDDAYGSSTVLSAGGQDIPIPDLPVGRLVTTPTQIDDMLQAYLSTPNGDGVVSTPTSSLVTGYDFMTASADAVESNLAAGLGPNATNDTLITNDGVSPSNTGNPPTQSWTATQLESALLGKRHDLIYLAGHFSANNTLAADDSTTMNATQLASSSVNLQNSIVFSPGCHSGYNIASEDAVPGVTQTTDWIGAFAQHGATLIAGTGYQYGDTDFLAYSDQLYADFSQQLLVGSGPVAVGSALTAAESTYLDDTPDLQGIDIKSVLEATLYGLPMLSVNMPDGRTAAPTSTSTVSSTTPAAEGTPGATLGLSSSDLTLTPSLNSNSVPLESPTGGTAPTATYLSGPNGVDVSPAEPTLPLSVSDVSVPGQVLRGVGFMGGTYTDQSGVTPLTGAPASDLNSVHSTFSSGTFFPSQLFTVNYFGGLNGGPASTKLMLTPAQYKSDAPGSLTDTQRSYSSVGVRLFYSDNTQTYGSNTPALAAPPSIGEISATASGGTVTFQAHVVGDPSAGIQRVWVTYTGVDTPSAGTGEWESLYLTQDSTDSTLWSGTLSGLSAAQINNMQFLVQAVNGVGLVGVDDNDGSYFQPGQIPPTLQTGAQALTPTTLSLNSPPSSGNYGSTVSVSATLSDGSGPVASQLVNFTIGDSTVDGKTNSAGTATAQIPLEDLPGGSYQLSASYDGSATLAGTSVSTSTFAVNKLATTLTLSGPSSLNPGTSPTGITATLQSGGVGLSNYSVEFELTPTGQTSGTAVIETALTSLTGVAQLPSVAALVAGGTYSVSAFFGSGGPLNAPPDPIFSNSTVATALALSITGQAPAFTSASSATFTVGSAGSFPIVTTGVPANTIALGTGSGCAKLPTGVALSGTGNTATLSGTPAAGTGGSYALCLTASNGVGTAATQAFTLKVDQAPAFTSAGAATFTVGSPSSFPVTTTGYPVNTISLGTGSGCAKLPTGVTLAASGDTATLSGTPAAGTGGSYALCLTASNGVGTAATQAFTLTVTQASQAPAFTSAASTTFTVGSPGSFGVTTTGYPANTISLGTGSGCAKLPTGVTLAASGDTATLSGTPAAGTGGSYALCLTASNGVGTAATQAFTLKVDQAPAFTSTAAATFTVGSPGSFPVTTTGYPAPTVTIATGNGCVALPAGLSLSGTGTLSGTPAAGTSGSYSICLTASNGVGTAATQAFTLTITNGLSSGNTACNGTYAGSGTTVTVAAGAVCTLLPGAQVSGSVQVNPGGALNAQDVSIGGNLTSTGANWIELGGGGTIGGSLLVSATLGTPTGTDDKLCNETISGSVSLLLSGPGARFDIGNLGACSGGPGLSIGGGLLASLNTAPVTIGGNTIKTTLVVNANLATLTVTSNTVGGAIQVYGNILGTGSTLVGNSSGASCSLLGDLPAISGSKNTVPARAPNSCNANA